MGLGIRNFAGDVVQDERGERHPESGRDGDKCAIGDDMPECHCV